MKESNIYYWVFLVLASLFEVCWLMSLKFLDFPAIIKFEWFKNYKGLQSLAILQPFLAYIVFGLANVYFFSVAIKKIPIATAFSIWLSLALVVSTIIDVYYFRTQYNLIQLVLLFIIVLCVIGLKMSTKIAG